MLTRSSQALEKNPTHHTSSHSLISGGPSSLRPRNPTILPTHTERRNSFPKHSIPSRPQRCEFTPCFTSWRHLRHNLSTRGHHDRSLFPTGLATALGVLQKSAITVQYPLHMTATVSVPSTAAESTSVVAPQPPRSLPVQIQTFKYSNHTSQ